MMLRFNFNAIVIEVESISVALIFFNSRLNFFCVNNNHVCLLIKIKRTKTLYSKGDFLVNTLFAALTYQF